MTIKVVNTTKVSSTVGDYYMLLDDSSLYVYKDGERGNSRTEYLNVDFPLFNDFVDRLVAMRDLYSINKGKQ